MNLPVNQIICGDSLEVLRTLPDESIDCVITSPPYWALRDYQLSPQIWDGDGKCKHRWGDKIMPLGSKSGKPGPNATVGARFAQDEYRRGKGTNFCSLCSAWRGSLGLEPTFELYLKHLLQIFDETKRVLKKTGTCWVNIGDTYCSHQGDPYKVGGFSGKQIHHNEAYGRSVVIKNKHRQLNNIADKCLCQIPFRFSIEMVNKGWVLRNTIIWHKRNCMPSSVKDRFTVDFEYIFFFVKNKKYWFEQIFESNCEVSIKRAEYENRRKNPSSIGSKSESYGMPARFVKLNPQGHNKRCVWQINTKGFKGAHFAVFPEKLIEPMILAGCPKEGTVLDCFSGAGTTGVVCKKLNRNFIGIELSPVYCEMARKRIDNTQGSLF